VSPLVLIFWIKTPPSAVPNLSSMASGSWRGRRDGAARIECTEKARSTNIDFMLNFSMTFGGNVLAERNGSLSDETIRAGDPNNIHL
jgi:hypothetical protein